MGDLLTVNVVREPLGGYRHRRAALLDKDTMVTLHPLRTFSDPFKMGYDFFYVLFQFHRADRRRKMPIFLLCTRLHRY